MLFQQYRDVLGMLTERRDEQPDDVEAIEESGSERVGSNACGHIRTGCGHESRTAVFHADLNELVKLPLHRDGQFLDAVNQEGAVLRLGD